jgi:hypothetical protein
MPIVRPLAGRTIAISISDSPDLAELGLGRKHLQDALVEIARHLLTAGAHLAYGGDLRAMGFTELLFELVARHQPEQARLVVADRAPATNYLAWPVHMALSGEELLSRAAALEGVGRLVLLRVNGAMLTWQERAMLAARELSTAEWARGLTTMRRVMTANSDARILLGGPVEGYRGAMPGIAEEASLAIAKQQPTMLLGGFGGCTRDIAETMQLIGRRAVSRSDRWKGRRRFSKLGIGALRNGLSGEDTTRLVRTVHVDEMVALILRGLGGIFAPAG